MKRSSLIVLVCLSLVLLSCNKPKGLKYQSFDPSPDYTDDLRVDDSKEEDTPKPDQDSETEATPVPPPAPGNSADFPPGPRPRPDRPAPIPPEALTPEKSLDEHNLEIMLDILYNYSVGVPYKKLDELVKHLEDAGLAPIVSLDTNPYTGGLTVIRNFKNLVGTRYFIAQYEETQGGSYKLQHMSFEYRPGPDSFALVRKIVEAKNPLRGTPTIDEEGIVTWPLYMGYHVFVRKLTEGDIYDSPINVYFPNDIGTIKVGIEIDPHAGEAYGHEFGDEHGEVEEDGDDGDEYTDDFLGL